METKLAVCLRLRREKFIHEIYLPSDDIFALVVEGGFNFSSGNKTYTVGPYEAALFKKGVLYTRCVTDPVTMYLFRYKSDASLFLTEKVTFLDNERIRSTVRLLEKLDEGVLADDFEYRTRIFSDIVTQYEIEKGASSSLRKDPIDKALAAMISSLHQKVYLPEISKVSGLSYTQFARRFKERTGLTPSDYMANLKLEKAKKLLSDSELLIREIAPVCGFENEYYFSNFFKKMTGISPKEYREFAQE